MIQGARQSWHFCSDLMGKKSVVVEDEEGGEDGIVDELMLPGRIAGPCP
jgi:hypothetical protein